MTVTPTDTASEQRLRRTFARRWRVVAVGFVLSGAANLLRPEAPLGHAVPSGWAWLADVWTWLPVALVPLVIWAARCPACGGWIRLDGRTCAACKRDLRSSSLDRV